MGLIRVLRFVLMALLTIMLVRSVVALVSGLFGRTTSHRARVCPNCRGTGWVAVDATTQRACDCGVLPEVTQGRILDPPDR